MIIKRSKNDEEVRLRINGKDTTLALEAPFFGQFPSRDFIRIRKDEYEDLPESGLFTHFNIQVSYHVAGKIYLLPKIIEPGHFNGEHEVLPLLDFTGILYGECTEVQEHVPYEDLTEQDFTYSLPHIKSTEDLKKIIVKRYSQSLPHISPEELLELGISKTTLNILGRV
jgi:hypothetical protein